MRSHQDVTLERTARNIRYLRQQKGMTQQQFADLLGIKRSLLGAYEEGRAKPNMAAMERLIEIFGITIDSLLREDFSTNNGVHFRPGGVRVLTITVDKANRENIEFVPVKAAAGYLTGYADPEFISHLPKFNLPNLAEGTYRAFEIVGDSMLPIPSGSIMIGHYVEGIDDVKEGQLYILISRNDGIVFKRIFGVNDGSDTLLLRSDNPAYPPYTINTADVLEIWKARAYISTVFPESDVSLQRLMETVIELKGEVGRLKS